MSIKLLDTIYKLTDNADKVDGKHASDFATSGHTHSYLPLSGGTIAGTLNIKRDAAAICYQNSSGTTLGWLGITSSGVGTLWESDGSTKRTLLHSGNSSVSKSGETLTVKINGTTQSLTNTNTWRGITDSYSGTATDTSLSQKGGKALYDALVNGYATSAGNADTLDNYHRKGLYSSIPAWINANEYTKTVTVNGDANTYYPVVISTPTDKEFPGYVSVWKNLGTATASYYGNHSNGTSSMWLIYEVRNWYWDGNGGYLKCWYRSMPYATLCAKTEQASNGVGALVVYLRGGGTQYKVSSTYGASATVYLSTTNIGDSTYPVNVTPTTSVGNGGMISSTYLGYGGISGSSGSVRDAGNSTEITFKYSSGGFSSSPSYLAAWNNYQITYVSPSNVTVGNASSATKLDSNAGSSTNPVYFSGGKPVACTYSLNKTVPSNAKFTDTNTWRGITDSYSGTATDTSLSQKGGNALYNALVNGYASSAGNADTLDGYHASSFALSHSHNYHPLGGYWKPSSLSSYTRHWGWAYSSAEAGLASNGTEMQIYTDGKFWQREGAYYCLDNGNTYVSGGTGVINGTTITNVSYSSSTGYVANGNVSNLNTPSTWSSDGSRLVYDNYSGSASNKPVSHDNANSLITLFKTKHGTSGQYTSQLAFPDNGRIYHRISQSGTWKGWSTVAFTSDIPSSLPANGGNADTVDGKHASDFAAASHSHSYASSSHTHKYAGSSSAGGAATSANKLNTNAGSATKPVYFTNGVPTACTYGFNGAYGMPVVLAAGYIYKNSYTSTTWAFSGSYCPALTGGITTSVSGGVLAVTWTAASGRSRYIYGAVANMRTSGAVTSYSGTEYKDRSLGMYWLGTATSTSTTYIRAMCQGNEHNDTGMSYVEMWGTSSEQDSGCILSFSIIVIGYWT